MQTGPLGETDVRTRVLRLVESGKVSAAEAAELLKAMRFAAVPVPGEGSFILLPLDEVNFDDLRQRTVRFIVRDSASDEVKADMTLPFERAQNEIFRLLRAIYGGSQGTLIDLEGGDDHLQVSLE